MSGYSSKFDEWARRPDTKAKLASAKKNEWAQFTKQFPNADKDKFNVQTSVDGNFKISAEVFFNESADSSVSVFGSDRKYWSQQMKNALGFVEGFPFQLLPLKTKTALPIPALDFTESVPSIAKIFNQGNRTSMQRQTNFSLQTSATYFNKSGSRTKHRPKQKNG